MVELPEVEIEFMEHDRSASPLPSAGIGKAMPLGRTVLALLVLLAGAWWFAHPSDSDESEPGALPIPQTSLVPSRDDSVDALTEAARIVNAVPVPLLAAELFVTEPSPVRLRALLESIGGFAGVTLGTAQGAFDMVGFDPRNPDRLLAVNRSSYGQAQNQARNQEWIVDAGAVLQTLWSEDTEHDFAHFNVDGSITMWVHGGGQGFAPRRGQVLFGAEASTVTTQPIYASRTSTANGVVFALTGNGDYYTNEDGYVALVASDGRRSSVLAPGSLYSWVDNPVPELVVAYPVNTEGVTAVWDTETLEPLDDHVLANRSYQRVAVSGDRQRAVGVTFDGQLEEIDFSSGAVVSKFGSIDPTGIDRPVTLNVDGSVALTVDHGGLVVMWWVGEDTPIATASAVANPLRWLSEPYAPRSSSAVAVDAGRVALKVEASPGVEVTWTILDTDVDSWVERACTLAGRTLERGERSALNLVGRAPACAMP